MNRTERTDAVKICFVAPRTRALYQLLSGENPKSIGGPEIHLFLLAKELIKHNFKVSVISSNEGRPSVEYISGIQVINIYKGTSLLKTSNIMLELFRIWSAMKKANAHIYIHRGGVPGAVSPFCKLTGRKFICSISSDALVNRKLVNSGIKEFSGSKFSLATFGNWLDIKLANSIIVQNGYQKKMLKENFGKNGVLIKKPFPLIEREMPEKANPPIVLWVGSTAEVKQPELFVQLAEAIPEAMFQMIGGCYHDNQALYDRIIESAKRIQNFESLGVIPFNEINKYFSQAAIIVNTSMFEAYPTHVFIQGWMNYTPVVSLHDNSYEILCRYNMGFHSKTLNRLIEDVKTLLEDEVLRKKMGVNGRKYVEREHDITIIVKKYIELFNQMG
jgi:glycosyltransferase involved in cell wall biosynthesis